MSKVDAMQAMREARYAARAGNKPVAAPKPVAVAPRKPPVPGASVPPAEQPSLVAAEPVPVAQEELCGHRSMNNRLCKRPAGHSEKNHRYN